MLRIADDSAAHCVADESEEAREPSTTCSGGVEEPTTMVVMRGRWQWSTVRTDNNITNSKTPF